MNDVARRQASMEAASEMGNVMSQIAEIERARSKATTDQQQGDLNAQMLLWAQKAVDVLDERPDEADAAEYYALARVLEDELGPTDTVGDYLHQAMKRANDFRTYSFAGQTLGLYYFARGDKTAAERVFAKTVHPKPTLRSSMNEPQRLFMVLYTRGVWAAALREHHQCDEFEQQVRLIEGLWSRMRAAGFEDAIKNVDFLKEQTNASCVPRLS